jgi:hypothetical protein
LVQGRVLSGAVDMSKQPRSAAGDPMTLGDMRENRVRWLAASCWICHHQAVLSAERWPTTCLRHHPPELERAAGAREPDWSAPAVNISSSRRSRAAGACYRFRSAAPARTSRTVIPAFAHADACSRRSSRRLHATRPRRLRLSRGDQEKPCSPATGFEPSLVARGTTPSLFGRRPVANAGRTLPGHSCGHLNLSY